MSLFGLGPAEILLILFVMMLFFGKDKLPDLAKSIGRAFRELKDSVSQPSEPSAKEAGSKKDKS